MKKTAAIRIHLVFINSFVKWIFNIIIKFANYIFRNWIMMPDNVEQGHLKKIICLSLLKSNGQNSLLLSAFNMFKEIYII